MQHGNSARHAESLQLRWVVAAWECMVGSCRKRKAEEDEENTTRGLRHAPLFSQSCNIHVAKDGSGGVHGRERVRRGGKEVNPNYLLNKQTAQRVTPVLHTENNAIVHERAFLLRKQHARANRVHAVATRVKAG